MAANLPAIFRASLSLRLFALSVSPSGHTSVSSDVPTAHFYFKRVSLGGINNKSGASSEPGGVVLRGVLGSHI